MDEFITYGVAAFSAVALGGAALLFIKSRNAQKAQPISPLQVDAATEPTVVSQPSAEFSPELVVADSEGRQLVKTRLITQIPAGAPSFSGPNDVAVNVANNWLPTC
ncbi:hypothetical protein PSGK_25930 [Pseudomonas solani]|uniref:hypothetical protein n=1 Tax=Pseudomonas solani TaxID=2731552 RepID=UPI0035BE7A3D